MRHKALNAREKKFALLMATTGNATQSYVDAGYTRNRAAAAVGASKLIRNPKIVAAIQKLQAKQESAAIADAHERDTMLSAVARNTFLSPLERIAAIKELNKVTGRHSVTHLHKGTVTLEQVIAESRRAD